MGFLSEKHDFFWLGSRVIFGHQIKATQAREPNPNKKQQLLSGFWCLLTSRHPAVCLGELALPDKFCYRKLANYD